MFSQQRSKKKKMMRDEKSYSDGNNCPDLNISSCIHESKLPITPSKYAVTVHSSKLKQNKGAVMNR